MTEITVFAKHGGPLTKRIALDGDGAVKSDGSQCVMSSGTARRFSFDALEDFCRLLGALQPNQAIATGALRTDLPEQVQIVTKNRINGSDHDGIIARSQAYIGYRPGEPALVLVDYDTKGMPPAVVNTMAELGGLWPALTSVLPALANVARIERASTSAGLFDSRNGEPYTGTGGKHVYVLVADGTDNERFLKTLHERCWLFGLGWMLVGAGGKLLERSIVDRVCGSPERLAFEGRPVVVLPLAQDLATRHPIATEGEALDTREACPPLTIADRARLHELRSREAYRLAGECGRARKVFIDRQAQRLVQRTGMDPHRARKIVERQTDGVLRPDIELEFDDPALAGRTVADVLADPDRFEGETLADPLEGIEYGRCKARIMRRDDGTVWINSFAHGRTTYEVRLDHPAVKVALAGAAKDKVADTFVRLALAADLDEDEIEELRNIASENSDVTKPALSRKLKAAQQAAAARSASQEQARRIAARQDPRLLMSVPPANAEYLPQMQTLNDQLRRDRSPEPPTRNPNHRVTLARKLATPSLHDLTATEANDDDV